LEKNKKKRFHWRGMTTFLLVLGLLVETVSGIIIFITPLGRFARWNDWILLGLDKWEWAAIHSIFAILLLTIIVAHLYFNWRVIAHFVWSKLRNAVNLKWELAVSIGIAILLFAGTILNIPPFSSVMTLREKAKLSWEKAPDAGRRGGYGRRFLVNDIEDMERDRWQVNFGSRGRGYGRRARMSNENDAGYDWTRGSSMNRSGRGRGFGRRTSEIGRSENVLPAMLKGRDIARLGQSTTIKGILMQIGEEWSLKARDTVYAIHLGPREYRESKGFFLKGGQEATVEGFMYKTNVSVTRIETDGKSIMLRDETGRPAWAGTSFGRGNRF
jgi:hypothetical protein